MEVILQDKRSAGLEPLLVPIKPTADLIGRGLTTTRELVKLGELEGVKAGKLVMVTMASIKAYVARLPRVGSERQEAKRDAA